MLRGRAMRIPQWRKRIPTCGPVSAAPEAAPSHLASFGESFTIMTRNITACPDSTRIVGTASAALALLAALPCALRSHLAPQHAFQVCWWGRALLPSAFTSGHSRATADVDSWGLGLNRSEPV
ncbi:hypothetical protein GCM10023080_010650 [Streptomyces pseudoechinosporeus]